MVLHVNRGHAHVFHTQTYSKHEGWKIQDVPWFSLWNCACWFHIGQGFTSTSSRWCKSHTHEDSPVVIHGAPAAVASSVVGLQLGTWRFAGHRPSWLHSPSPWGVPWRFTTKKNHGFSMMKWMEMVDKNQQHSWNMWIYQANWVSAKNPF